MHLMGEFSGRWLFFGGDEGVKTALTTFEYVTNEEANLGSQDVPNLGHATGFPRRRHAL